MAPSLPSQRLCMTLLLSSSLLFLPLTFNANNNTALDHTQLFGVRVKPAYGTPASQAAYQGQREGYEACLRAVEAHNHAANVYNSYPGVSVPLMDASKCGEPPKPPNQGPFQGPCPQGQTMIPSSNGKCVPVSCSTGQRNADGSCVPPPCANPSKISAELRDAANSTPVRTQLSMSPEERAVLTWLRIHLNEIIQAETKWNIDRRAIAGAIAWEALYNVQGPPGVFNRWAGPGKPHYWDVMGTTAAEDAENAGYLPKISRAERQNILSTSGGAINYIGAIMRSDADALSTAGYDISRDPTVLTFYYHARDLEQVQQRANELIQQGSPPLGDISGSEMAKWVQTHLGYLEEAIGKPDSSPPQDYATSSKEEKCIPLQ